MADVITYGTFDLFHVGNLRLLQRAKKHADPGGTLTMVVSTDRFNREEKDTHCAVPDCQRAEIVSVPRCVDKVLFDDSWDQKRQDDIDIDIFGMGDDWASKFDFLKDLCEVVYLPRTPDISSSGLKQQLNGSINIK